MANKLAELYGVPVYETGVGFKYVAPKMLRGQRPAWAARRAAALPLRNHIPERDGILAGLYLLDLMVRMGKTPSQLIEHLFSLVGAALLRPHRPPHAARGQARGDRARPGRPTRASWPASR